MRIAPVITLSDTQREQLQACARSGTLPRRLVERAQMILLAAEGRQDQEIARMVRRGRRAVARWRHRFIESGLAGIEKDAARPGRKPKLTAAQVQDIVRKTTQESSGAGHSLEHPQYGASGGGE